MADGGGPTLIFNDPNVPRNFVTEGGPH